MPGICSKTEKPGILTQNLENLVLRKKKKKNQVSLFKMSFSKKF